jgi:hypothetical protein
MQWYEMVGVDTPDLANTSKKYENNKWCLREGLEEGEENRIIKLPTAGDAARTSRVFVYRNTETNKTRDLCCVWWK